MKYEIKYKPAYSLLVVQLSPGEALTAEAGAMAYMQRARTKPGVRLQVPKARRAAETAASTSFCPAWTVSPSGSPVAGL